MAEQTMQGFDPINYGMGTGWLDYANLLSQMLTQQGAAQGATGTSVLGQLANFLTSPTAGPLGLAATAAYGNPQAIARATEGKGFDASPYTSNFDQLLNSLVGYTSNINKQASDIPVVDPNKAPAPTPENAAKAPNIARDWVEAYNAYHPGAKSPLSAQYGLKGGGVIADMADRMLGVPQMRDGGTATPTPTPGNNKPTPSTVPQPPSRIAGPSFEGAGGGQDPYAAYGGKGLVDAMTKYVSAGGDANKFVRTIQAIGKLGELVSSGKVPVAGVPPVPGQGYAGPQVSAMSPELIRSLLTQYGSMVGFPGFADGGVTLAGKPHWIVDENGYPVAAITEDGAPENVRGLKHGGVEVTPLRPDRFEQYTGQDAGESDMWGRMLARMDVTPGAATGQKFLFPDIPGSGVDTSPEPGSNLIPSAGGPSEPMKTGTAYGAGSTPSSLTDLFKMTAGAPGANRTEQYAQLLGGALSQNTTAGELVKALNQGRAPSALPSRQQLSTMSPSQRAGYMALLQQMGIVQSPEDFAHFVNQYTPAGLG